MLSPFSFRLGLAVGEHGPLCVGIDPSAALLASWGLPDSADGAEQLARTSIEAVAGIAGIIKIQVAFFERHGAAGYRALERIIADGYAGGFVVIADAKRGDIPSTNEGYADAWLHEDSPLAVDAVTVSCYLGIDAMTSVFQLAHQNDRGVIVVVSSSNDEGRTVQTASLASGTTVEEGLLEEIGAANAALDGADEPAYCIGAVIGAQRRPDGLSSFDGPVLVPGLGAQGAGAADANALRAILPHKMVCVTVSRGILQAGPSLLALRSAAQSYVADLG